MTILKILFSAAACAATLAAQAPLKLTLAEAEAMAGLFGSPVNRALINVFFLTDRNKKDTGIDRSDVQPAKIRSVAVIGAGIMGQGIAAANVKREVRVVLADAAAEALERGLRQTLEEVAYNKQQKGPDAERAVKAGLAVVAAIDSIKEPDGAA